ncbi:aspartate/ornithine carbamoyltransferase family protein [Mycobacterium sp. 050134]|uniref:aspartate/ornithine carbamoyltransferase family protein n=1 Tax=Mycobacterium sp. 050134 TaxID=3096111 RepID=UPI002ED7C2CF
MTDPTPWVSRAPAEVLDRLAGKSIISVLDMSRDELLALFSTAARLQITGIPPKALSDKILLTAFFEPSTRTRLSFESAALRLGGSVISVHDVRFASVEKGESLSDTGVMFASYADAVVLRHFNKNAVHDIRAGGMMIPLINGGNGCHEHPTQAMADWYTLAKWRPKLMDVSPTEESRISLCILGTPRRMRSIRSFLLTGVTHFPDAIRDITIISDENDPLDVELLSALTRHRVAHRRNQEFQRLASEFDVIYQNALALVGEEHQMIGPQTTVDANTPLKPGTVVMHPLARRYELSTDLDATPHNLYFDQAAGAVPIRQALLLAVIGRLNTKSDG